MQTNDDLKDELKEVSFGISGKRRIPTPEGYFDQLPGRVVDKWKIEELKSMPGSISIRRMISTAALITGVCFGVTWWTHQSTCGQAKAEISSEDAYQYIIEHMDDFAPMMLERGTFADELNTAIPPSTLLEEYLLEELEGEDFENIF